MTFFFFKQKTAYEMRISDWSSDLCSSDLASPRSGPAWPRRSAPTRIERVVDVEDQLIATDFKHFAERGAGAGEDDLHVLGDRTSVGSGKSVSVRVDLGGRRLIKKHNSTSTDTTDIQQRRNTHNSAR